MDNETRDYNYCYDYLRRVRIPVATLCGVRGASIYLRLVERFSNHELGRLNISADR